MDKSVTRVVVGQELDVTRIVTRPCSKKGNGGSVKILRVQCSSESLCLLKTREGKQGTPKRPRKAE